MVPRLDRRYVVAQRRAAKDPNPLDDRDLARVVAVARCVEAQLPAGPHEESCDGALIGVGGRFGVQDFDGGRRTDQVPVLRQAIEAWRPYVHGSLPLSVLLVPVHQGTGADELRGRDRSCPDHQLLSKVLRHAEIDERRSTHGSDRTS